MQLRALLFDLDDTLIVDQAISHHAFMLVAQHAQKEHTLNKEKFIHDAKMVARQLWEKSYCYSFCHAIGISALECLWGNFSGDTPELTLLRTWAEEYRPRVFHEALMLQKINSTAAFSKVLMEEFMKMRRQYQKQMPHAKAVIADLSKKYKLGLLTNGAPDLQREKIEASGLREFFSAVVISGEHGIGKPKPAIFQKLLDQLEVTAEEAVMIGNSMERDIAGAHAAGIRAIWIHVPGAEELVDMEPDATINELTELLPLLEKF